MSTKGLLYMTEHNATSVAVYIYVQYSHTEIHSGKDTQKN